MKKYALLLLFVVLLIPPVIGLSESKGRIEAVRFETTAAGGENVVFQLNGPYIPTTFGINDEEPPRVVFDFVEIGRVDAIEDVIETKGKYLTRIRIGDHEGEKGGKAMTRVVLDLAEKSLDVGQTFDDKKNVLTISLTKAGVEAVVAVPPEPEKKEEPVAEKAAPAKAEEPKKEVAKVEEVAKPAASAASAAVEPEEKIAPAPEVQPAPEAKPEVVTAPALTAPPEPMTAEVSPTDASAKKEFSKHEKAPEVEVAVKGKQSVTLATPQSVKAEPPMLKNVSFEIAERGEMVLFALNGFHTPKVTGIEEGKEPRVVCDFGSVGLANTVPSHLAASGRLVSAVRSARHDDKTRVVLDLRPGKDYDLQQVFYRKDNMFVIIVNTLK